MRDMALILFVIWKTKFILDLNTLQFLDVTYSPGYRGLNMCVCTPVCMYIACVHPNVC